MKPNSLENLKADAGLVPDIPAPENKRFYPALNGLRAVAVLMVFGFHYMPDTVRWGWAGVDIFFVLSGFLITGILYDTRDTKNKFRNFYARRTLRIFPLYYGVLLLILVSSAIFHWKWDRSWYLWPLYIGNYGRFLYPGTVLHNSSIEHFWSLCVEEQFYLIWPFIVYSIKDRVRLRNLCGIVILTLPIIRLACNFILPAELLNLSFVYFVTPLRADSLLLGGFIALCLRGPEADYLERFAGRGLVLLAGLFLLIFGGFTLFTGHGPLLTDNTAWMSSAGYTLIDLSAAGVILLSINSKTFMFRLLNLVWLRRLGEISYGFYVFHNLLRGQFLYLTAVILPNTRHPNLPTAVIGFFGTLGISYVSFRFFESKFLRLKKRFSA